MPRPNPVRSLRSEVNLARRIGYEREQRGWTYEGTAKRLTDIGCPIQPSAVYKIEKADPPRRITVDELVAFAEVFGVSVEQLLVPVELAESEALLALFSQWAVARQELTQAEEAESAAGAKLRQYVDEHPELSAHLQKFVRAWVEQWAPAPDAAEALWMYTFTGSEHWSAQLDEALDKRRAAQGRPTSKAARRG